MKYIITDQEEVIVGHGYHQEMAAGIGGEVVAAGECEFLVDGWTVYGRSHGFGIRAKNSDRDILNGLYPNGPTDLK